MCYPLHWGERVVPERINLGRFTPMTNKEQTISLR